MPNTPNLRLENCYMPPKKSAWRFENPKFATQSPSESETINNYNMGLMSENEMKPVVPIQFYPSKETFSNIRNEQHEEVPLDFSVKKDINRKPGFVNHSVKPISYEFNENNIANNSPVNMVYPNKIPNGNNTHSPPLESPAILDTSQASSSKDSDSFDLDYSQESAKSPSRSIDSCVNRVNEMCRINSAEHINNVSRENSPSSHPSILEEMLKNRPRSNNGIPNGPQAFGHGFRNGLGIIDSQIIASHSPPMAMNGPVMHPSNILPIAIAPYFGYGYDPSHFMNSYMYKHPEPNMVDVSSGRKTKKKFEPLMDSLKSYSIDELRQKLNYISGGGNPMSDSDYAINSKSLHISQRRHFSNNASPETVTSSNNGLHENGEKDKDVESNNQTNNINHIKENDMIVVDNDVKCNGRNSQDLVNHNDTNNTASISYAEETSDSVQSAINESPSDVRKRKTAEDYKNDPQYRLKRAKNNAAARRSRESRRIKEELIRQAASMLEQKNKVLCHEISNLRYTVEEANLKYLSLMKEYESLKIHNSVLNERLNQKRCGQCGSAFPNVN